jgi:small-conductance mechanosensitive channel
LSAQRVAAERSKIYQVGVNYSEWLDQVAKDSSSAFLQRRAFDRVTWMRLIASIAGLVLLSILASLFIWIVGREAGEIKSRNINPPWRWLLLRCANPSPFFSACAAARFRLCRLPPALSVGPPAFSTSACLLQSFLRAGSSRCSGWLSARFVRLKNGWHQWAEQSGSLVGKVIIPIVGNTLRLAVPLLGVILLLPVLRLPENWTWVTRKIFGILLIVAISFLVIRVVNAVQAALLSRHRLDTPKNLSARKIYTQVSVIRKIIVTAVVILATGSILMLFDPVRQFGTSILASAGIAGVVIGFAAQKTLGNVLAGIQIALAQPFLIDDIVVVEGEFGQIEEITLTYVTVRTWDLRRMILPITYFVEKPFQNWSRVSTELLGTVILYLDYQVPMSELRKELKRLAEKNPKWDRKVCGLQVTDAKQNHRSAGSHQQHRPGQNF